MLGELKTRLSDLERAAQAAEGRDEDLAGMVAGLNRAFGAPLPGSRRGPPRHRGATAGGARRGGGRPGGELQRASDREDAIDARVHPGVPAGHRQLHEPEDRQGQVVNEPLVGRCAGLRQRAGRGRQASFWKVTVAEPDRPEQVCRPRKSPRTYARGGRLSDMERLLERNETRGPVAPGLAAGHGRYRGRGCGGRDAAVPQMRNTNRGDQPTPLAPPSEPPSPSHRSPAAGHQRTSLRLAPEAAGAPRSAGATRCAISSSLNAISRPWCWCRHSVLRPNRRGRRFDRGDGRVAVPPPERIPDLLAGLAAGCEMLVGKPLCARLGHSRGAFRVLNEHSPPCSRHCRARVPTA